MSNSPYLPPDVKQYMKQYRIEEVVGDSVNEVIKSQSEDPYAQLSVYFNNLAPLSITIEKVSAFPTLNNEGHQTLQFLFSVRFKGSLIEVRPNIHYNQAVEGQSQQITVDSSKDLSQSGNGPSENSLIKIVEEKINDILRNKQAQDQKIIDDGLTKYFHQNPTHLNLVQPISFSLPSIVAQINNRQVSEIYSQDFGKNKTIPKIFVNLLHGSKVVGSKCKVFKFYLVVNDVSDPLLNFQLIQNVVANLRKAIVSGKQGEAALKFHADGTMMCTLDTIADNLKQVEMAIDQAGGKDKVGIGLVWMADLFYNGDQKKYELENPKQLLDVDQLIDFYFKLCSERPYILYMEDPIQSEDIVGWHKIMTKFQDHRVKLGSRKLYQNLSTFKKMTENVSKDTHPDLTEQEIAETNQKRITNLAFTYLKPFEYPTYTQLAQFLKNIVNKRPITSIILGDNLSDTTDTNIIDLAFSIPNSIINISGPLKYEKILKYSRYIELAQSIKSID